MRKLKLISMVLVVIMIASMIPFSMLTASAATTAFPTLPNGEVYGEDYYTLNFFTGEKALSSGNNQYMDASTITDAWRGAEGLLLAYKAPTGNANGQVWMQIQGNISTNTGSFARAYTQPNANTKNTYQAARTDVYNMANGTTWVARAQGVNGAGSTSALFGKTSEDTIGWLWIPMETFRWYGPGGNGNLDTDASDIPYELVGKPMTEILEYFEIQKVKMAFDMYAATATLLQADWVFFTKDNAKPADGLTENAVVTNGKVTGEDYKVSSNYSGLTINGVAGVENSGKTKKDVTGSLTNAGELVIGNMWVDNNTESARAFVQSPNTSLKDAIGFEFTVDSSKLGTAQLQLRSRLQVWQTPANLPYATNTIYNTYGSSFLNEKVDANGDGDWDSFVNNGIYEVFNNKKDGTGTNGGYAQMVTRTADSVAYITGTDSSERTYTNYQIVANATFNGATAGDAFTLPAGFVGTVYIPMDSYWISVYGSYSSACLIPFDEDLFPTFDSIGFYSNVTGTPTTANEVTYSNFNVVKKTAVEINNEDEFMSKFINPLTAGTDNFANKVVRLNADLDFTGRAAYTISSAATFAGVFDGENHVIKGLTATGSGNQVGLFGQVANNTSAVVKDVSIIDSSITATGWDIGGIFGYVGYDSLSKPVYDISYVNKTKATFINVYNDIDVTTTTTTAGQRGTGGFIGELQGDADFIDCVYTGTVKSAARGIAGLIGSMRTNFNTYGEVQTDWTMIRVNVDNLVMTGTIAGAGTFKGGLIGYHQQQLATIRVDDSYIVPTFQDANGAATTASCGTLGGGSYANNDNGCNRYTSLGATVTNKDYQIWILDQCYTVANIAASTATTAVVKMYTSNGRAEATYNAKASEATATNTTIDAIPDVLAVRGNALQQSVTLTDDLALNIYIPEYNVIAKSDDVKLTLTVNGNENVLTKVNGYWSYSVTDILPQEMNKEITASVTLNGDTTTKTTSIAAYLKALLADANQPAAAKKLASDLLRYGDAAQNYVAYETGKLASAGAALVDGSVVDAEAIVANTPEKGTKVTAVALRLENTLALIGNDGTVVEVYASEMDNDKTVGDATCSVAAYVKWALEADDSVVSAAQKTLIQAIYAYGMSAKAYKG